MARLIVTSGPGPISGNDPDDDHAEQRWICRTCGYTAISYGRVEKHAGRDHPRDAVRIEQPGLIP